MFFSYGKKLNIFRRLSFSLLGLVLMFSCARAPVSVKEEVPVTPEASQALKRLDKADKLLQRQAYPEALAIYEDYLKRYPKGLEADTTLMKIGTAFMSMGNYSRARQAFSRLLYEHGESSLVPDARLNIILTYYQEEKYADAVQHAEAALEDAATKYEEAGILNLMGHSQAAGGQFKEAVGSYMSAYRLSSAQDRSEILSSVRAVIASLQEQDLKLLIDEFGEEVPGDYLRLQLARVYAEEDRDGEALAVLSDFDRIYPGHEESGAAMELAEEIKSRALVDRFSIGCILPLSGPYESFGRRALEGIELALTEFSAGKDASPVQLLIRDSRGDFSDAVLAVESLALEDGAIAIIGPMVTSEAAAIRAQALKIPIITLTQKPDITKLGDYVFRNFLTAALQVRATVRYAVKELGIRKFAVVYPDERYGLSFMSAFWDELLLYGAEVVGIESYDTEETDFAEVIKKLSGLYYPRKEEDVFPGMNDDGKTPPENLPPQEKDKELEPIVDFGAVFIPDSYEKVALIAPQFPFHDVNDVLLIGTNLWNSEELIQTARNYVQGAIVPDGFYQDSKSPRVRDFVQRFENVFGTKPGFLEALAYDTARMIFQLANSPEVRSRHSLRSALLETFDFPGVTGLTSFDETGDADKQVYLLKIKGPRFVQIEP